MFCEVGFEHDTDSWKIKTVGRPIAEFIFDSISHDKFARNNWYATSLGKNVFMRCDGAYFTHGFLHQDGCYIIKVPLYMLKIDVDSFYFHTKIMGEKNPKIDFELPVLEGLPMRFFNTDFLERVTGLGVASNPYVNNLFYFKRATDSHLVIFYESAFLCFGLNEKTVVAN